MRQTWDETWLKVAITVAKRSRCVRRRAGCVVVDANNRIVSTGYNGPPAGLPIDDENWVITDCLANVINELDSECDEWCPRAQGPDAERGSYDNCVSVHAEPNALMFADRSRMEGGTVYVTSCPCFTCAKDIANSGAARAVFAITDRDGPGTTTDPTKVVKFLLECGLEVRALN